MRILLPALLAAALAGPAAAQPAKPVTPAAILARAPAMDWQAVDADDLLVIDLYKGGRIIIQLAPTFAPAHVANIRALARGHWYDNLFIERVQDDYVTQWGDPSGKKVLPNGIVEHPPAEYDRPAEGLKPFLLPYKDTYAEQTGFVGPWPTAISAGKAWMTHCYGMVGVGRDLNPDTGSGSELYAVIGHAPRALDRNIALVGRVLQGMDILASLPRGDGELGIYTKPAQFVGIRRVRLASELSGSDRPYWEVLKTDSATYKAWSDLKANRRDEFFLRPAGAVDVCTVLPPLRVARTKP
jgi:peptidylprolyl isomerase